MFPEDLLDRLATARVVAGFSVEKAQHAAPIARALLAGGIDVIELTLRTEAALEAIESISQQVPEILLGVGTILTPDQAQQVRAAGADFGVSPGCNPKVIDAASNIGLPFAPGIATPSEIEVAIEHGCRLVKYFPAAALGGVPYLRSMSAPYRHLGIQYFPLGGINSANMLDYLQEPNVPAVGGSWIVKQDLVSAEDWPGITSRAAETVAAAKGLSNV